MFVRVKLSMYIVDLEVHCRCHSDRHCKVECLIIFNDFTRRLHETVIFIW